MLKVEAFGAGPELVMLHGWGMHSGLMASWAKDLAATFRVSLVDLPGHGDSGHAERATLGAWADAVLDAVPAGAWWLGWSLGGLVALEAAQRRTAVLEGVVLVASTPKFVAAPDWRSGVEPQVFEQFASQLQENIDRTLQRFLSLQLRGSDRSGELLRQLRAQMKTKPQAHPQALRNGLRMLKDSDMRGVLETTRLPVFALLGERDTLVPQAISGAFAADHYSVIGGAAHAPFLSHPQACTGQIRHWLTAQHGQVEHAAAQ